jgi:hypothetical protein
MMQYLRYLLVNNDNPIAFSSPLDGEVVNYTVMAWWYCPVELVSGEVESFTYQYSFFNHLVLAWNDAIFEITGK